jgi:glycosyltransferase involved in cell wall biosynthesis
VKSANQETETTFPMALAEPTVTRPSNICIVTPDLMGPVKNGGIGTHVHWLSRAMAKRGHAVTVLFSGEPAEGGRNFWVAHYASLNVKLIFLSEVKQPDHPVPLDWELVLSYRIYHYLKTRDFDSIHFQDWKGTGFHTMMAKKAGVAFRDTPITVTLHSSVHWASEGMEYWPEHALQDARVRYAEEFAAANADVVVSPSRHMVEWVTQHHWALPQDVRIQLNCFDEQASEPPYEVAPGVLAFFGRLETRKGPALLIDAILSMTAEQRAKIRKLWFVGKVWFIKGEKADQYISKRLAGCGIDWEIVGDLGAEEALAFLREQRATAICPSLSDNSPYTIVECAIRNIPVVAANVGGVPELLHAENLFDPNPAALRRCLEDIVEGGYRQAQHKYNAAMAAQKWNELIIELAERKSVSKPSVRTPAASVPGVSICIPFFNAGRYLDDLLHGLAGLRYEKFEIIFVDDASSEPLSDAQQRRIMSSGIADIRFARNSINLGIGGTRNHAAALAKYDLLQFVDADNCPRPEMLSVLVDALQFSGADAATCMMDIFLEHQSPRDGIEPSSTFMPLGPALNLGVLENVFGDANFLVRKPVWKSLGGFAERRGVGWEDWEFLARLSLRGFTQIVVPERLFWYRKNATGVLATASRFPSQLFILDAYAAATEPWVGKVLGGMLHPFNNYYRKPEDIEWAAQAVREGYAEEMKFVSDVLSRTRFGKFIRRSSAAQKIIERIFGPK